MRVTEENRKKYKILRELEALAFEMNYTVDAVIVEGPHDKKTLMLLGYRKPILCCSQLAHQELANVIALKFSTAVILTDFDEQGKYLHKKLTMLFERNRVKVDQFYRRRFYKLLRETRIMTIEGIYNLKLDYFPSFP